MTGTEIDHVPNMQFVPHSRQGMHLLERARQIIVSSHDFGRVTAWKSLNPSKDIFDQR